MKGKRPQTIAELRASGYKVLPVRDEMRKNIIQKIRGGDALFPGIVGYEESVIPQLENAILAGQDVVFLGERGQAKTRIMRTLISLLDEEVPVIAECEINDNPYHPVCKACRQKVEERGEEGVDIAWLPREERYGEKLATPDTTIADLIGEVDPIKVAEGRYLADELTIHYGLIPRTNRGIFCINELPDLAERIQVGLFNILEERDVQIRGYKIRLPLDVYLVASANPEDYTSRGRIITPLKDRYGAEVRTHYPRTPDDEIRIMEGEHTRFEGGDIQVKVPQFMREVIAEITAQARKSSEVNQRSGVSVRVSICNYETLVANAIRRAIRLGESLAIPRISDLPYLIASTTGKIELDGVEEGKEVQVVEKFTRGAVSHVFQRYFRPQEFEDFVERFQGGVALEVSESMPAAEYVQRMKALGGLTEGIKRLEADAEPASIASAMEFILEGLHLAKRLNKEKTKGKSTYRV